MPEQIQATLILAGYRIVTLAIGALIVHMGYRLFLEGVFRRAGELKAVWGERSLLLRQTAPGTFFALFGTVVLVASLWRGISVDTDEPSGGLGDRSPSSEARTKTKISAAGGVAHVTLLSVYLRDILSRAFLCETTAVDDTARKACSDEVQRHLVRLPTLSDLSKVDSLEASVGRAPTAEDKSALEELRRQFVRPE